MAVENWIDNLTKLWAFKDPQGKMVKSYSLFGKTDFPSDITEVPCAISWPTGVVNEYNVSAAPVDIWEGRTEFHLTQNVNKDQIPYVIKFFAKIRNAAAAKVTLGNKVFDFHLRQEEKSIEGPVVLKYGAEEPHYGLIVYWQVTEYVDGDFTIGG